MKIEIARELVRTALAHARKLQLAPLAVTVLDAGGNLVCFERENGAGIARYDISFAKAWGSLGMGFPASYFTRQASPGWAPNAAWAGARTEHCTGHWTGRGHRCQNVGTSR